MRKVCPEYVVGVDPITRRHHPALQVEHKNRQAVDMRIQFFEIAIGGKPCSALLTGRGIQQSDNLRTEANRARNMCMSRHLAINCSGQQIKLMTGLSPQVTQPVALGCLIGSKADRKKQEQRKKDAAPSSGKTGGTTSV